MSSYSNIILTKNEYRILKKLSKKQLKLNDSNIENLYKYNLVYEYSDGCNEYGDPIPTGIFKISDAGIRYLIYINQIKSNKKVEWIRYIITTLIAIIALIISILSLFINDYSSNTIP